MKYKNSYRCPVCRAAFRETAVCSRCGVDLTGLMTLAAEAYFLRQNARQAISEGDWRRGLLMAGQAQDICGTPQGKRLHLLASWYASHYRIETTETVLPGIPGFRSLLYNITEKLTNRIKVIKKRRSMSLL